MSSLANRAAEKYSAHIDYLVASVMYLGTQEYWWARTPREMASELSLDEEELLLVFEAFPGIFRKSHRVDESSRQHMYSLQARYAKKGRSDASEAEVYIPPLETEKIELILNFILQSAQQETTRKHTVIVNLVAVVAAVVSAVAAIVAALIN